jgi:6-phospho-beta-glucosidase
MQQVKAVDRLVIEAATTGSADAALRAFALHPLVDSVAIARELLRGYTDALPEVAQVLHLTS